LQEFWFTLDVTQIVGEVVLVVRTWTIRHTHSIVKVLDRVTGKARGNDRTITSLAILVALKACMGALL
jgi:hypothetical protein